MKMIFITIGIIGLALIALSIVGHKKAECLQINLNDDLSGLSGVSVEVTGHKIIKHIYRCKNGGIILESSNDIPTLYDNFVFKKVNQYGVYIYFHKSIGDYFVLEDQKIPVVIFEFKDFVSPMPEIKDGFLIE